MAYIWASWAVVVILVAEAERWEGNGRENAERCNYCTPRLDGDEREVQPRREVNVLLP